MIYRRVRLREHIARWVHRHTPTPPVPEPGRERSGTLSSDGTPCRGWPGVDNETDRDDSAGDTKQAHG